MSVSIEGLQTPFKIDLVVHLDTLPTINARTLWSGQYTRPSHIKRDDSKVEKLLKAHLWLA